MGHGFFISEARSRVAVYRNGKEWLMGTGIIMCGNTSRNIYM